MMIDGKACELDAMPEVIAREPNGAGIGRDKVLEVALKSIESRLSELRHDDEARLWRMLNDPHLSYAEGGHQTETGSRRIQPVRTGVD